MKFGLVLTAFLTGAILGGLDIFRLMSTVQIDPAPINYQTVRFADSNTRIFIAARAWGVTGDHEEVRLCTSPINFPDMSKSGDCMVFYTDELFYRREGPLKLRVVVPYSSVPNDQPKHLGQVEIVVEGLKDYDKFKEIETSYEKRGFALIAVP